MLVLIGPDGNVVTFGSDGEALEKKIATLLEKSKSSAPVPEGGGK
jgi:hypothetical protein